MFGVLTLKQYEEYLKRKLPTLSCESKFPISTTDAILLLHCLGLDISVEKIHYFIRLGKLKKPIDCCRNLKWSREDFEKLFIVAKKNNCLSERAITFNYLGIDPEKYLNSINELISFRLENISNDETLNLEELFNLKKKLGIDAIIVGGNPLRFGKKKIRNGSFRIDL